MLPTNPTRGKAASTSDPELNTALGVAWAFAYHPRNASDPLAAAVRLVLQRDQELANLVPRFHELETDNRLLSGHVRACRRELARLRALLHAGV